MSVIFNIHSHRRAAAALSIMLLAQTVLTGCSVPLPWQKSETAQEAEPAAETAAADTAAADTAAEGAAAEGAGAAGNEAAAQDAASGQAPTSGQAPASGQTPAAAHSSESAAAAASDSEGSAAGTQSGSDREGAVLNIYAWDDSLRSILVQYYSEYHEGDDGQGMIGNMQVNWVIPEPEDYQEELDKHLLQNSYAEADEKVDLYLVDGDSLSKYINTAYSMDLTGGLGLTEGVLADQFPFTVQAATDAEGKLKGVTWIASPGVFVYKRSIANAVLGTDDPTTVQAAVADWDQFAATAAAAKSKGYAMVSGIEDSYYAFRGGSERPWVLDGEIMPDENVLRWADQTRILYSGGFTNDTIYKGRNWMRDLGMSGDVFGFFLSAYELRQLMSADGAGGSGAGIGIPVVNAASTDGGTAIRAESASAANLAYGDYGLCIGPQAYYRGGIWMMAAPETDNRKAVRALMEFVAGDTEMLTSLGQDGQLFVNSRTAMEKMARGEGTSVMFDGQNQFTVYLEAAERTKAGTTGVYDNKLGYLFRSAMQDYIYGDSEREEALAEFVERAKEEYPVLAREAQ